MVQKQRVVKGYGFAEGSNELAQGTREGWRGEDKGVEWTEAGWSHAHTGEVWRGIADAIASPLRAQLYSPDINKGKWSTIKWLHCSEMKLKCNCTKQWKNMSVTMAWNKCTASRMGGNDKVTQKPLADGAALIRIPVWLGLKVRAQGHIVQSGKGVAATPYTYMRCCPTWDKMKLVCQMQINVPEALEMKLRQGSALGIVPGHSPPPLQCQHVAGSPRVHLGCTAGAALLHASLILSTFQQRVSLSTVSV